MDVYEFEKSLLERMEESYNVLQCKESPVPASDVRDEWACHVELKIEPAGEYEAKFIIVPNFLLHQKNIFIEIFHSKKLFQLHSHRLASHLEIKSCNM